MKFELSREIENLVDIHKGRKYRYPTVAGMAFAILTDEQGQEMIELLNKWIEENNK